jgi:peptidoglycan LD-endopeptidase LytH
VLSRITLRHGLAAAGLLLVTAVAAAGFVVRPAPPPAAEAAAAPDAPEDGAVMPADAGTPDGAPETPPSAPVIVFPVAGHGVTDVVGRFGDPRDGGRRRHLGVDIAAPTGTPVVAPVAGIVDQVEYSALGGRAAWLRDDAGLRYYFAHLHTIAVTRGQRLAAGGLIGTVGQTGNAAGTGPHLHFAIREGPHHLDPAGFLSAAVRAATPAAAYAADDAGDRFRVRFDGAALRSLPGTGKLVAVLRRDVSVVVLERAGGSARVRWREQEGWVADWLLQPE